MTPDINCEADVNYPNKRQKDFDYLYEKHHVGNYKIMNQKNDYCCLPPSFSS